MAVSIISVVSALMYASVSHEAPLGLTVSFISKIKSLTDSMTLESTSGCTALAGTTALAAMVTLELSRAVYKYVACSVALALACRAERLTCHVVDCAGSLAWTLATP